MINLPAVKEEPEFKMASTKDIINNAVPEQNSRSIIQEFTNANFESSRTNKMSQEFEPVFKNKITSSKNPKFRIIHLSSGQVEVLIPENDDVDSSDHEDSNFNYSLDPLSSPVSKSLGSHPENLPSHPSLQSATVWNPEMIARTTIPTIFRDSTVTCDEFFADAEGSTFVSPCDNQTMSTLNLFDLEEGTSSSNRDWDSFILTN